MNLIDVYNELRNLEGQPELQEQRMREILNEYFDSIEDPERRKKLQQIQWRVDGELRKYKDPVARLNKMVELFWKGVYEFIETTK